MSLFSALFPGLVAATHTLEQAAAPSPELEEEKNRHYDATLGTGTPLRKSIIKQISGGAGLSISRFTQINGKPR